MTTLSNIEKIGRFTVALIFILSGSIPLFWSDQEASLQLLNPFAWSEKYNLYVFYALIVTDIGLGILALFHRSLFVWIAMLIVTLGYTIVISIYSPILWLEPLGSIPKNIPIISWLLVLIALNLDTKKSKIPLQGTTL